MNETSTTPTAAACENCETVLVGGYCHVCGQRAHNPLHSLGHALEEVFESFWHLDGRIFSTLRDLFVPGRLAKSYLDGQRVKYIPPLRLFIILSLLTFFVGKLTLHVEPNANAADATQSDTIEFGSESIAQARTVEEVLKIQDEALADIRRTREDPVGGYVISAIAEDAEAKVQQRVLKRLNELKATPEQLQAASKLPASDSSSTPVKEADQGFFERWFVGKLKRIRHNMVAMQKDPDQMMKQFLGAVPGALLMLLPVFALCLKVLYIRSGRGYLEHLVVALYSHAFMLAGLLVTFLMIGVQMLADASSLLFALGTTASSLIIGVFIPLYLLLMQKRVYAQSWIKTCVKFLLLGVVYTMLLGIALLYAGFAGLSS